MSADSLLSRLDGAHCVAAGRWRARCPAHHGKNAQVLSIGEATDGTVLVKCFAGCSAAEIVAAVGLQLSDLFPRVDWQSAGLHHVRPHRRPRVDWPALILACERDLLIVKIALSSIARQEAISEGDAEACRRAATRVYCLIQEARNG
jgi:hypothetical protein